MAKKCLPTTMNYTLPEKYLISLCRWPLALSLACQVDSHVCYPVTQGKRQKRDRHRMRKLREKRVKRDKNI